MVAFQLLMGKKKVTAILYPGCIFNEIALSLEFLARDFEIVAATPDGNDHHASNGLVFRTATAYSAVDLSECAAILIPGGDPGSIKDNSEIDRIVREADEKKLLLAAICAGPFVLAKAGVLAGKRIAHGYRREQLEVLYDYFKGVTLTGEPWVADGNIITAKPEAFVDFSVEVACRLNVVDADRSGKLKDYYKGMLGRKVRPLALACIRRPNGQFLFHRAHDRVKGEASYRPLGGGIEFGESGRHAIEREIKEELNLAVKAGALLSSFENIFSYEGQPGHELILLFSAEFADTEAYAREELDIVESEQKVAKAVWRSIGEIREEGAKLYPLGIETVLARF